MKNLIGLMTTAGLSLLLSGTAGAQQQPQPLPINNTNATTQTHHYTPHGHAGNGQPPRFPMSSARYEQFATLMLDTVRKSTGHGPMTAGVVNKIVLEVRECVSNAEANGVVTRQEHAACTRIFANALREVRQSPEALQMLHP